MNRECLEKISRSLNVCRVTDCCECHKRMVRHWGAYTRSKNHFSRYRGSGRDENPKNLTSCGQGFFKKLEVRLAAAIFGGLVRSEGSDSGNGVE